MATRIIESDSVEYWRQVAQGLGIEVHDLRIQRDELLTALKKIVANGINAEDYSHRTARAAIGKAVGK